MCQDSAHHHHPPPKKPPRCTRNTHRRGLFPSFPLGKKHLRGQDPTWGPLITPGRRMGCESIPPADPVHARGEDGLPMPALCCLFPGSSARRPPRDPPSTTTPGSCRLCPRRQTHRSRPPSCSPARGTQRAAHLRRGQRDGGQPDRVSCAPHPEPGRLADGSGGFYPKITQRFTIFFFFKRKMQLCLKPGRSLKPARYLHVR